MTYGWPWSKELIAELSEKEFRDEFVADKVRTRIALMIRALRDDESRQWSQTRLGKEMGKPANVISRLEDPDYGKMSLQTLLEVAAAFDLPLMVDIPSWDEWFRRMRDLSPGNLRHDSFSAEQFGKPRLDPSATRTDRFLCDYQTTRTNDHKTTKTAGTHGSAGEPNVLLSLVS